MEQSPLSLLLAITILFISFSFILKILTETMKTKTKNKKLPRSPWRLPILGNLHLLDFNKPHHSLLHLSNKYGPLLLFHFGPRPSVIVSSHRIADEIFTHHDITFSDRPALIAMTKFLYNNSSIFTSSYNDQWRQSRKIATIELLSSFRVRSFERVRGEEVNKLVAAIRDLSSSVNLSELALSFSNNVVCRATLGDEFGDGGYGGKRGVWLHHLLSEIQSLIGGFCMADYYPRMKWVDRLMGFHERLEKTFTEMDRFFDRVIGEQLRKGGKEEGGEKEKDLLQVMLRLHQADERLHGDFLCNIDHVKAMLVVSHTCLFLFTIQFR